LLAISELIVKGQRTGQFHPDLEPQLAAVSILSQLNWFCIAGPAIEMILGREGATRDPVTVRTFADHAVRFALAGLAARDAGPHPSQATNTERTGHA
jgi:hypothetical protein